MTEVSAQFIICLIKTMIKGKKKKQIVNQKFISKERAVIDLKDIFFFGKKFNYNFFSVILASIVWGKGITNKVGLLVLCAKTLKEIGRTEFSTPTAVPKCLHGWFASEK